MQRSAAVDNHLFDLPEVERETMQVIRELIFLYVPEVEEQMKWNTPCYSHKGLLCYINFEKKSGKVVLSFIEGCMMEDTYGLFQPGTKQVKKIYFNHYKEIKSGIIRHYLNQAVQINRQKTKNFLLTMPQKTKFLNNLITE